MSSVQHVAILGATGTIGLNTLDVIARHPNRFSVFALTAHSHDELLFEQCQRFSPRYAVLTDANAADKLRRNVRAAGLETEVLEGLEATEDVAARDDVDTVMAAIVGAAGLKPTLAAVRAGKRVLLANKEALVMSGSIFMDAVRENHATLLPIDSEHNAVFQVLPRHYSKGLREAGVRKILLTASGGPFRKLSAGELATVTPAAACRHPNWVMGRKISVDSASMMNKGLEVIEASWLFSARSEQIEIVVHPESVIHSMVSFADGSVIAQLGNPDMRTPIAFALGFPERIDAGVAELDLVRIGQLNFEPLDRHRFPCVDLAYQAIGTGGTAPAILNAGNEIAVQSFLDGTLAFSAIPTLIDHVLGMVPSAEVKNLEDVLRADGVARQVAREWVERR